MKVLLSIKPKFADLILSGKKKYEFRRAIFKQKDVKKVVMYASAPISKIVGEFEVDSVISDAPDKLWKKTERWSGINEEYFNEYFDDKKIGYAIKIKKAKRYRSMRELGHRPPQSFQYLYN